LNNIEDLEYIKNSKIKDRLINKQKGNLRPVAESWNVDIILIQNYIEKLFNQYARVLFLNDADITIKIRNGKFNSRDAKVTRIN
jgi:glutathione synthase/RimK-type ligase-like ATP-grasp enzyme